MQNVITSYSDLKTRVEVRFAIFANCADGAHGDCAARFDNTQARITYACACRCHR